ncbi:unnamed protein product [Mytilus coruscus]|uniref:Uncharacterized protein n=1 Tax=Mytilus coruscus TaxID=42192 RepID=A0A6J8D8S2_MYTCO|nr:unnamed protein product [Mytilus coruscus]
MFNNTLTEENLSPKDKKIGAVIEDLLEECELNKGTSIKRLKKSLETLEGTYVVKEDSTYKIIHDKLFDFLAKYFGEKMLQIFIDHANTGFITERFLWKITDNMGTEIEFVVRIPDNCINRYIDRLLKDWENGYVNSEELVCTKDIHTKDIALGGSCYMGTIELVKWLISRNSDINYCRKDGYFPLLWASQNGHVNVVKELLQHLADVNKCRNNGITPLLTACYYSMIEVVHVLLQCDDVDISLCDDDGCSSLYWASQNGHVNVVKELLQHSADVNKCSNDGNPPLQIACYNNRIEPNIASQKGHVNIVIELLQHSADVNKCRNDGHPPLQTACNNNRIEVVRVLLQCDDVDINLCNDDGCSSLYKASQKGHVDVVKVLLQHSADVNKCKNNGVSPLYKANEKGHVDVVKELLQHSADVNKCSNDGTPPLHFACYNNRIEVVHVLLQCDDVDIDLCDDDGCSSLYIASENGHVNVVIELLQHSADVNKCNNNDVSPLYIAGQNGHVDVVKELLQHSADVNKCDFKGKNPLNVAQEQGHIEIESLLKGKGIDQH